MDYIIVQAGGKGTRMGCLTKNKPKALVPVDNLPMLFHLFKKYPDKRFIVIADYKKEVMRAYLEAFADVKYLVAEANGTGTCAGIKQAIDFIPPDQPFMLVWSDLILPESLELPFGYNAGEKPAHDYLGLSQTFPCRWKYENGEFAEETSYEYGVSGFFLFTDKSKIGQVALSGELVKWMSAQGLGFHTIGIGGAREFGILEEYEKLAPARCRPFNRIRKEVDQVSGKAVFVKEAIGTHGEMLARHERAWYEEAKALHIPVLPEVYGTNPLTLEWIDGVNIYDCDLGPGGKRHMLEILIHSLKQLHGSQRRPADPFSIQEAFFKKTMRRLAAIEDLVPFAREREIVINGKICRNIYYYKRELERALSRLSQNCAGYAFIHGDCTFSNMMVRKNGDPVLIDPRGYFGFSELYGDVRYDWAKLYYSMVGNYDQFNLKRFKLDISEAWDEGVKLVVASNHWEPLEGAFFELTGADPYEIKLLHGVIWLSLTTYAWQDYDSICGAFYNGLWYLEEVL